MADKTWRDAAAETLERLCSGNWFDHRGGYPTWLDRELAYLFDWGPDEEVVRDTFCSLASRIMRDHGFGQQAVVDLLCAKQRDYGHGNILRTGLEGVRVRISDKVERYKNLVKTGTEPENESLQDTLIDIVGYCVIGTMLLDETFTLPLEEERISDPHFEAWLVAQGQRAKVVQQRDEALAKLAEAEAKLAEIREAVEQWWDSPAHWGSYVVMRRISGIVGVEGVGV